MLTLPYVLIALIVAAALGGWAGFKLAGARAGSRRRDEEAWESEVVRAAGCARDRAIDEKDQFEERLDRLQREHARCEERIDGLAKQLRDREAATETSQHDLAAALEARKESEGRIRTLDRRVEELETSIENRDHLDGTPSWLLADPDDVTDDLTAIRGLGKVIERRLNDLGIYRYDQLGQMTPENVHWIATRIHIVPGRILRDDWAEQAREMHRSKYGGQT